MTSSLPRWMPAGLLVLLCLAACGEQPLPTNEEAAAALTLADTAWHTIPVSTPEAFPRCAPCVALLYNCQGFTLDCPADEPGNRLSVSLMEHYFLGQGLANVHERRVSTTLPDRYARLYELTLPEEGLSDIARWRGDSLFVVAVARRSPPRTLSVERDSLLPGRLVVSFQYDLEGLLPGLAGRSATVETTAPIAHDEEQGWARLADATWLQERTGSSYLGTNAKYFPSRQAYDEWNALNDDLFAAAEDE